MAIITDTLLTTIIPTSAVAGISDIAKETGPVDTATTVGSALSSSSTYIINNYDIVKTKDTMAYIESMSREELVAFQNELSKIEKNIELEEQIDELLDESDSIRRI